MAWAKLHQTHLTDSRNRVWNFVVDGINKRLNMKSISAAALRRAADIQDKIESLNRELSAILGTEVGNGRNRMGRPSDSRKKGPRGPMSAAARAKIAAAAKKRWAKAKAAGKNSL
jgi:hypothetical protein